ncbi:MAG: alpha/beta hydrolase [Candidatus Heimdallarchaeota archaeon]|nr:alpha/beta hydrolase [Candidatus Heimdallarchaeota archaeon]
MTIPRISQVIYEIETHQGFAKLHHRTLESDGPPILMLHGFGSSEAIWFNSQTSLGNYFAERGVDCWTLNLSKAILGDITALAHEDLYTAINFIFNLKKQPVVIVAHSMGGIITRVLTSPNFDHGFNLKNLEERIRGVALLTVPNHGVDIGDVSQIEDLANLVLKIFKPESKPFQSDFGLGFVQLVKTSQLTKTLNKEPKLNTKIEWINVVGTYDAVVPKNSALFKESALENISIIQKEFPCDHLVYPLGRTFEKVMKLHPAIHRSTEVGQLVFETFFSPPDFDTQFDRQLKSKYSQKD